MNDIQKYHNLMRILAFITGLGLSTLAIVLLLGYHVPPQHEVTLMHFIIVKLFGLGFLVLSIKIFEVLYDDIKS